MKRLRRPGSRLSGVLLTAAALALPLTALAAAPAGAAPHGLARPAPYLARAKWVQLTARDALSDTDLKAYLTQAHGLIAAKLTRAARKALGLA